MKLKLPYAYESVGCHAIRKITVEFHAAHTPISVDQSVVRHHIWFNPGAKNTLIHREYLGYAFGLATYFDPRVVLVKVGFKSVAHRHELQRFKGNPELACTATNRGGRIEGMAVLLQPRDPFFFRALGRHGPPSWCPQLHQLRHVNAGFWFKIFGTSVD